MSKSSESDPLGINERKHWYCSVCGSFGTDCACEAMGRIPRLRHGTWRDVEKARDRAARRLTKEITNRPGWKAL